MKTEIKKSFFTALCLVLCGAASGAVNALIGTGGGIIITFVLSKLYSKDPDYSTKDLFSTVLLSVAIMSAGTCAIYLARGAVDISDALVFLPSAAVGGVLGALLLDKLDSGVFRRLFALLVIWAGISAVTK